MSRARVLEVARQFPENGVKALLQTPANVGDLLRLGGFADVARLELPRMVIDPTTYVAADFRHGSSDLVIRVPWRPGAIRRKVSLWLTVLVEHQSAPDRLMALRLHEYMVQIWKKQVRDHVQKHGSAASAKLEPVLPVVFYTGVYKWERLGRLTDLMTEAGGLEPYMPRFDPVFVNLPECGGGQLANAGPFGELLRVVQQRAAGRKAFEAVLAEAVGRLESLAKGERWRWLEMLNYLDYLVYHDRAEAERPPLWELIRASVKRDEDFKELDMMRKSAAQVDREKAQVEQSAETLLRLLGLRFGKVPPGVAQVVQATRDRELLARWLDQVVLAESLDEIGIGA